jgi:hypothetical protein
MRWASYRHFISAAGLSDRSRRRLSRRSPPVISQASATLTKPPGIHPGRSSPGTLLCGLGLPWLPAWHAIAPGHLPPMPSKQITGWTTFPCLRSRLRWSVRNTGPSAPMSGRIGRTRDSTEYRTVGADVRPNWQNARHSGLRRGRETARQAGVLEPDEAWRMAVRPAAGISWEGRS